MRQQRLASQPGRVVGDPPSEVLGGTGSSIYSLPEVFDLAFEQLYDSAGSGEHQGTIRAQVHGPAFDGLAEAPDAYPLSQGAVQVSPLIEDGFEVFDTAECNVEVRY